MNAQYTLALGLTLAGGISFICWLGVRIADYLDSQSLKQVREEQRRADLNGSFEEDPIEMDRRYGKGDFAGEVR